jgi:hypothetical protein
MRRRAPPFCYHPAVAWAGFLFLFSFLTIGETLEDGARTLARSAAIHLSASERAHVTMHNLTALNNSEAARIQLAFERTLRRNQRNPTIVDVTLTVSDNVKGFLLVAEIFHGDERAVEMTSIRREPSIAPAPAGITLTKKLLWEQSAPILDVALVADFMFVLDTSGVSRYERREGKWDRVGVLPAPSAVRDPRGRLDLDGGTLTIQLPGNTCRGTWNPSLSLHCDGGSVLTAGRNTLESESTPAHFSRAQIKDVLLLAETDERTHVYDSSGKAAAVFDGWGSDFIAITAGCASSRIVATSGSFGDAADFIALYDIVNNAPVRLSDPAEFPGRVTALWPAKDGALAIAQNISTGRYEAYSIAVDCGR